jgi:hypothetical protein
MKRYQKLVSWAIVVLFLVGVICALAFGSTLPPLPTSSGTGSGNVTGAASSTAHHLAKFSDTTGKALEDGGAAFDPASPGTIGGTTPGAGDFSSVVVGGANPFSYHNSGTIGSTATLDCSTYNENWGTLTASTAATVTLSPYPTNLPFFVRLTMPAANISTLSFSPTVTWEGGTDPKLPPVNQSIWFRFFYNGSVLTGQWSTGTATQVNLGVLPGTLTDGDLCTYTASGTLFSCNTATTAVGPVASTTTPSMDGSAAYGSGTTWARADHVHPVDTSRAAVNADTTGLTAAHVPPVLQYTGTSISLTAPAEFATCSTTCTATAPVPPATGSSYQFCVANNAGVSTVITIAMPASVMISNQAMTAYGTAGTGHGLTLDAAAGRSICFHSVDATHYNIDNVGGPGTPVATAY